MAQEVNMQKVNLKRGAMIRPLQYTVKELEYILGAGESKVRQWIEDGRLPSYRIDGTIFVYAKDVWEFVQKHRNQEQVVEYAVS
jgi:excisionase family DNA binding protein